MANKNRGEVSVKLAGIRYIMRPTFQAICSIESEVGKSILDILINLPKEQIKISEIELIVKYGILACDKNPDINQNDIGDLIYKEGVVNILPNIIEFLELSMGINHEEKNGIR
ncbi:MAG: gene transfer agent family protein [Alphaproteobacteria bacterium]|nr:gene transfer agent family protein [Alphaproteobacteria bacterium]